MRSALILAAGQGCRLNGSANGTAKCLVQIGETSLVEHHVRMLRSLGIERIGVVVGHDQQRVRDTLGDSCTFIVNDRYAETNSLYSLWLGRSFIDGPFVLMNADVLAHRAVFERLLAAEGTALTYDSTSGEDDEHMKIRSEGSRLNAIAKVLDGRVDGENVGILHFDEHAARHLFEHAEAIIRDGGERAWAPRAVGALCDRTPVQCVDVSDLPWCEIDFPEDLVHARESIWPAVELSLQAVAELPVAGDAR